MSSLLHLIPGARRRMRSLQFRLSQFWDRQSDGDNLPVPWDFEILDDLQWWTLDHNLWLGQSLQLASPDVCLYTDASTVGWGASILHDSVSGVWATHELSLHINLLELKAIRLGLLHFKDHVRGQTVAVFSDNATALSYLAKEGGTRSGSLNAEAQAILQWAEDHAIQILTQFVKGSANVLADCLSRQDQIISTEWTLHQEVCNLLWRFWNYPTVDLFATRLNFRLPNFISPVSGSNGSSHRRLSVQLGSSKSLCLPTFPVDQEGAQQAENGTSNKRYSDCSVLATEGMVPRPHTGLSRHSQVPTAAQRSTSSASCSQIPSSSPHATANRVETVKRILRHRGYSSRVTEFLAKSKRPSTIMNYQYKWKRFREWCKREGHTVSNPTSQKIADFLVFLRQDCRMSVTAIKGYKAMLNGVFALKGFDLSTDPVLREVIKTCSRQVQRPPCRAPSWNVDVVLKALTCPPFEPLHQASLRDLTKKTLFLVALATAKRVGELHALSQVIASRGEDLILSYLPEFIAKTETPLNPVPREFPLRSLSSVVGREDEERLLCPVRAVRRYLAATASASRPRSLFVSLRDPARRMSKAAISFFLRDTIKTAHESFPEELGPLFKVRAHDIRGIATSMLLWKNSSVASILEAACWKTHSVFVDYYLRDIQRQEGDVSALGPVIAAGNLVGPLPH
ncbi:uncharacterized protein LOC123515846 [Portunus trituberculatus]|uniref:uncharacterized protein LOC123515846 n=1 Tax=Portunus trituberculatus TaxID=210409 RepID=UPI001E1D1FAB|nr:uncharacterized protein LOC123515846 [Portunus trituberculatus]